MTRLEAFIKANDIKPSMLAREAAISRQHLLRLRKGTGEPTRRVMVALATAARDIVGRRVSVGELFALSDGPG